MQTGWRIGTVFNIPLFIDTSWLFIVLLITFMNGSDPDWIALAGQGGAWVAGFFYALLLFGSVLLHELGHSLVAKAQGINVKSIKLFLFGGIASIEKESKTPGEAFQVAAAGPAVSLSLFVLITLLRRSLGLSGITATVAQDVAAINLVLCLFNLIPGLPLDGGQIFKSAVWKATGSKATGIRWAARSGQVVGWGGIVLSLLAFTSTGSFVFLWPGLIGLFILRNAGAYNRMNTLQEELSKLTTGEATVRDFRVLDANMTLREFADEYLLQDSDSPAVYYASSDGRYRGQVSIDDLRQVERSEWEVRDLHSIARPLLEIPHVRENTPLTEAIQRMERQQLPRLTVLTPADAVAGTLDRGDVVRAVAKHLKMPIAEQYIQKIKQEGAYPTGFQLAAVVEAMGKSETAET